MWDLQSHYLAIKNSAWINLIIMNFYYEHTFSTRDVPRAGNTLFGSLMNQNRNVRVTANSILHVLLYNILDTKNHV